MSIMVVLTFPVAHPVVVAWAKENPSYLAPINAAFAKHQRISHAAATSDSEFLDFDVWPSREAYAAFKAEAGAAIEAFESAFGHRSVEKIYDMV